jgi:hypothetical protein
MSRASEQAMYEAGKAEGLRDGYLRGEALAGEIVDRLVELQQQVVSTIDAHGAKSAQEGANDLYHTLTTTRIVLSRLLGDVEVARLETGVSTTTEASTGQGSDDRVEGWNTARVVLNLQDVPADLPPGTYDAVVSGLTVVASTRATTYVVNAVFKGKSGA